MSIAIWPCESRVLLSGVAWSTYEALLADTQSSGTRFTYDRGYLEIMSPSREHEHIKSLLGRMIEAMTEELDIPISTGGSTTLKAELKQRVRRTGRVLLRGERAANAGTRRLRSGRGSPAGRLDRSACFAQFARQVRHLRGFRRARDLDLRG